MLLTLRFPIFDFRAFSQREASPSDRLRMPGTWTTVGGGNTPEFINRFGAVRRRPKRYVEPWITEQFYCDAHRALRFSSDLKAEFQATDFALRRVYRRLYSGDGAHSVLYLDVQFVLTPRERYPAQKQILALISTLLDIEVQVPQSDGDLASVRLGDSGPRLASAYEGATEGAAGDRPCRVHAASPAICVEVPSRQFAPIRFRERLKIEHIHDPVLLGTSPVSLDSGLSIDVLGTMPCDSWAIGHGPWWTDSKPRELRSHVLRLFTEHQFLATLLKTHTLGSVERGSWGEDLLTRRLARTARLFRREFSEDAIPNSLLYQVLYRHNGGIGAVAEFLLDQAEALNPAVLDQIESILRSADLSDVTHIDLRCSIFNAPVQVVRKGTMNTGDHNEIINSTVIGSIVGSRNRLRGSITLAGEIGGSGALRAALEELERAVEALEAELETEEFARALEDAVSLAEEAARPEPRKSILKAFADQLTSLAKKAVEAAPSVAAAVTAILAL